MEDKKREKREYIPQDFIPLVGLATYPLRNQCYFEPNNNPMPILARHAVLLMYNGAVISAAVYAKSLLEEILK